MRPGFDLVFRTTDAGGRWTRSPVIIPGAATGLALGPPLNAAGTLVPVTIPAASGQPQTHFQLTQQATTGNHPYSPIGTTLDVSADPGNTALLAAAAGPDVWVLSGNDKTLYVSSDLGRHWSAHAVSGLPVGGLWLVRSRATTGFVMTMTSQCHHFKSDCTNTTALYRTDDGGRTWRAVLTGSVPGP